MPVISEFYGIKIYMYWDDHYPEHFHAESGELKALISIKDSVVIKGSLPKRHLRLVLAWTEIHKTELMQNWSKAREKEPLLRIIPLS